MNSPWRGRVKCIKQSRLSSWTLWFAVVTNPFPAVLHRQCESGQKKKKKQQPQSGFFREPAAWFALLILFDSVYLMEQLKILTPAVVPSLFSKVALSGRPLLSLRVYRPSRLPTCQHRNMLLWSGEETPHFLDIKGYRTPDLMWAKISLVKNASVFIISERPTQVKCEVQNT